MIRFLDGPAKGVTLDLQRTPIMLRAVRRADGEWDALDQPDDLAKSNETIVVYRMVGKPGWMHIDFRDKAGRRRGETRPTASYGVLDPQPGDAEVRSNQAWAAWCDANKERLMEGYANAS